MGNVQKIADRVLYEPEGGTADLGGIPLPTTGYFVGGAGTCLVFPSADQVDRYLVRHFLLRARSRHVGWWTDETTGKVYVDQVTWFDAYDWAEQTARERGEIAFWDIELKRSFRPVVVKESAA